MIKRAEFIKWLNDNGNSHNAKYISDMASRAARIERAFQAIDPKFSFEREYKKDKGVSLLNNLSLEGRALKGKEIALPVGTNQMFAIKAAAAWYVRFIEDTISKDKG